MPRPQRRITIEGDNVTYEGECIVTKETYKVTVSIAAVESWVRGMHIQDAMPGVSPGDREFLLSGISPKGWDRIFKDQSGEES
jgi:hypothetical protein